MKITKQELIELEACEDGLDRFIAQTNNTDEPVEVSSLVGGENNYTDLVWLADKKLPKERIVRFACDCALLNIERIKPYTDKYDEIVEFLRNPTNARNAARAAATTRAAASLAYDYVSIGTDADAAYFAADAANYAVRTVDRAAAHPGSTVTRAARAGIQAAEGNKEKVNELLRELFA